LTKQKLEKQFSETLSRLPLRKRIDINCNENNLPILYKSTKTFPAFNYSSIYLNSQVSNKILSSYSICNLQNCILPSLYLTLLYLTQP
jgi:hypothetical protein